jgi:hypothetical protein
VVAPTPYLTLPLGAPTVTLWLVVPNNPALLGFIFYAQSFATFTTPWLSSNGIEATLGL